MEGVDREGVDRGKVLAIIDEQVLRVCLLLVFFQLSS